VKPLQLGAVAARAHIISLADGWRTGVRFVLTFGLLISWYASANAAPVHRSKRPAGHMRPDPRPTVPSGFAVPGWTDEETRQWLYNGSAASGLG
jgi:hypothetical protein